MRNLGASSLPSLIGHHVPLVQKQSLRQRLSIGRDIDLWMMTSHREMRRVGKNNNSHVERINQDDCCKKTQTSNTEIEETRWGRWQVEQFVFAFLLSPTVWLKCSLPFCCILYIQCTEHLSEVHATDCSAQAHDSHLCHRADEWMIRELREEFTHVGTSGRGWRWRGWVTVQGMETETETLIQTRPQMREGHIEGDTKDDLQHAP